MNAVQNITRRIEILLFIGVLTTFYPLHSSAQHDNFMQSVDETEMLLHSNIDSAEKMIDQLENLQSEGIDPRNSFELELLHVQLLFARGKFKESIAKCEALLNKTRALDDREIQLKIMQQLAECYQYTGLKPRQLELNRMANNIAHQLKDTSAVIESIYSIGDAYRQSEDENCMYFFQLAYDISLISGNKTDIAQSLKYIGSYHLLKGRSDSARTYLYQALAKFQGSHYKDQIALLHIRIGRSYIRQNKIDSAKNHITKAIQFSSELNSTLWMGRAYLQKGRIFARQRLWTEAIKNYNIAQNFLLEAEDYVVLKSVFSSKFKSYEQMGMADSALLNYKLHIKYSDTVSKRQNFEALANIKWDYELEKKEKNIEYLKLESEILNDKNKAEKRSRLWLILALGAMTFLTLVWYQLYKQRHKSLVQEKELRDLDKRQAEQELRHQQQMQEMAEKQHALELELKNRELTTLTMEISQKSQDISGIHEKIKGLEETIQPDSELGFNMLKELRGISKELKFESGKEKEWQQFKLHFEQVHTNFFKALKEKHPNLTAYDLKLCAYFHMNLGIKQVSNILNVSYDAVKKQRTRMRKKMGLAQDTNLLNYLNDITISSKSA